MNRFVEVEEGVENDKKRNGTMRVAKKPMPFSFFRKPGAMNPPTPIRKAPNIGSSRIREKMIGFSIDSEAQALTT